MRQDFQYQTKAGHSIDLSLYGADSFGQVPCILYLHGFKAYKDWAFVPYMAEHFASQGISCLTFNFSHNGIGADGETFTDFDAFEQNTFSLELTEALEVIHLLAHTDFFGRYLSKPIGLLGHSRGGGIALLAGQKSRDIKAVCSWAAVSKFNRYSKAQKEQWKRQGYLEVKNSRTGQIFKLGRKLLDDVEKNYRKHLNIQHAVREMKKPLLLLHGAADETVPYFEGEELNIFSDPSLSQLNLIPDGTHTFGTKHPFAGSTPAFDLVLDQSTAFFQTQLNG
ncbi:MAG: prolyl oligopeptidase family serine peptidase [Bacteroidota bacterium]